ncbi:MAG: HlyD family efflux transporter periplasmic adaptor subunit [Alphaproteobacteria bacterium]|nr:HlyD family efflux transporter periplasmic adaptor subunit [Alphaproteobacteria bacterium]HPF46917.1 HlyD family efflux transporter periplasmic adaptor subunit [Emcibacteraceae bacterium]HRW28867.1 HlyD family efflux transporter periplasmic adaptor subunit [Emcibacteraceae bacterium]
MRNMVIFCLGLMLASCSNGDDSGALQGYVEGRQLNLAPRSAGILTALEVREGDEVAAGDLLFSVDSERAQAQLDEAKAASAAAEAQLMNLRKGGRPEEIRAAEETLKEARASYTLAEQTFSRTKNLVDRGVLSVARLDQDQATLDATRARVTEAQSRLDIIQLPARSDVIEAAERDVEAKKTAITRAETELRDRSIFAPVTGRIETVYRRVGEIAGPTAPVLALLPPDQKRIRFFVKEGELGTVSMGQQVMLNCDGCDGGLTGEIIYISDSAEFTPPVIFSEKERKKLVYLVEAVPASPENFHNGQPVEVTLK